MPCRTQVCLVRYSIQQAARDACVHHAGFYIWVCVECIKPYADPATAFLDMTAQNAFTLRQVSLLTGVCMLVATVGAVILGASAACDVWRAQRSSAAAEAQTPSKAVAAKLNKARKVDKAGAQNKMERGEFQNHLGAQIGIAH